MMHDVDILLFLNQDVALPALPADPRLAGVRSAFVVTTHQLFDFEEEALRRLFQRVIVVPQADLFTDAEMQGIDADVSASLRDDMLRAPANRAEFAARYAELMVCRRTAMALAKVTHLATWRKLLFQPGLGNAAAVLAEAGGLSLAAPQDPAPEASTGGGRSVVGWWLARARSALRRVVNLFRPQYYPIVSSQAEAYLFMSTVRRVPLRQGVAVSQKAFLPFLFLSVRQGNSMQDLRHRFFCRMSKSVGLAASLHGYSAACQRLPVPVFVFSDGYIPSNYPRTYVDGFGPSVYVCQDPFDCQWFERYGRQVYHPCGIMEYPLMPPRCSAVPVKTVFLMLNHAGDWTATIHRWDTDILALCFCRLARQFPDLEFVVRPHPTMVLPEHEGLHSRERLQALVAATGCRNLSCSSRALEDDLQRGDLFVSEYSHVLYQVFRRGKPGLICNLTRHESYMKDFADLGFACASSETELQARIAAAVRSPASLATAQELAAARFNAFFQEFFSA